MRPVEAFIKRSIINSFNKEIDFYDVKYILLSKWIRQYKIKIRFMLIRFLILIFSGFPLSAKFVIEWNLFCLLSSYGFILYLIVAFTVNVAGVVLFSKIMLNILYGTSKIIVEPMVFDIHKRELRLLNTLGCLLFLTYSTYHERYPLVFLNFMVILVNLFYIYKPLVSLWKEHSKKRL